MIFSLQGSLPEVHFLKFFTISLILTTFNVFSFSINDSFIVLNQSKVLFDVYCNTLKYNLLMK